MLLGSPPRAFGGPAQFRDEVVTGDDGEPLFRVSYRGDTVALMLPARILTATSLSRVKALLVDFLQAATPEVIDSARSSSYDMHKVQQ
jgi:hypothetical protein